MIHLDPISYVRFIIGASAFVLIMLLPALEEIKEPENVEPRRIMNDMRNVQLCTEQNFPIANIEEEGKFSRTLVEKIGKVIAFLPNLEA
jgi:hypothetical protein